MYGYNNPPFLVDMMTLSLYGKAAVLYRNRYSIDKKADKKRKKGSKRVVGKKEIYTFANDYNIRSFIVDFPS